MIHLSDFSLLKVRIPKASMLTRLVRRSIYAVNANIKSEDVGPNAIRSFYGLRVEEYERRDPFCFDVNYNFGGTVYEKPSVPIFDFKDARHGAYARASSTGDRPVYKSRGLSPIHKRRVPKAVLINCSEFNINVGT